MFGITAACFIENLADHGLGVATTLAVNHFPVATGPFFPG